MMWLTPLLPRLVPCPVSVRLRTASPRCQNRNTKSCLRAWQNMIDCRCESAQLFITISICRDREGRRFIFLFEQSLSIYEVDPGMVEALRLYLAKTKQLKTFKIVFPDGVQSSVRQFLYQKCMSTLNSQFAVMCLASARS
jgi:hypothetical protein